MRLGGHRRPDQSPCLVTFHLRPFGKNVDLINVVVSVHSKGQVVRVAEVTISYKGHIITKENSSCLGRSYFGPGTLHTLSYLIMKKML